MSDAVEDEHVHSPHSYGSEVVQDGMPDTVEGEGDQYSQDVVREYCEEVEHEHCLHGVGVAEHGDGVERIFEAAVVRPRGKVGDRVQDEETYERAPQALHSNEQQGRSRCHFITRACNEQ